MPLTATGTQVPWHNVGAAEAAKCCCPSADQLCDYTRMDAGQETWLGADWICELTPAEYAGLVAGGTWGVAITGSRSEIGTKFGGAWTGAAGLSGGGTAVRSGCDQKADFTGTLADTYSWVPSGSLSNTDSFNFRLRHVIGKYVSGIGTPNNPAKPYGLRMGDFTTLWPVGVQSGDANGNTWSFFSIWPTDLYYYVPWLDEWFETPAVPVTHPFYRGAWTATWGPYPSTNRTIGAFALSTHSITAESWSVDITWTASAP